MRLTECVFAWHPDTDQVKVGPWLDNNRWYANYGIGSNNSFRYETLVMVLKDWFLSKYPILTLSDIS